MRLLALNFCSRKGLRVVNPNGQYSERVIEAMKHGTDEIVEANSSDWSLDGSRRYIFEVDLWFSFGQGKLFFYSRRS